jgi:hypothetical protein
MRDVNIPLPDFLEQQIAEIEVTINGKKRQYNFRIESFRWEPDGEIWTIKQRLDLLREGLENYDKSWRLIQIFKPNEDSKFIQVLLKQKCVS